MICRSLEKGPELCVSVAAAVTPGCVTPSPPRVPGACTPGTHGVNVLLLENRPISAKLGRNEHLTSPFVDALRLRWMAFCFHLLKRKHGRHRVCTRVGHSRTRVHFWFLHPRARAVVCTCAPAESSHSGARLLHPLLAREHCAAQTRDSSTPTILFFLVTEKLLQFD